MYVTPKAARLLRRVCKAIVEHPNSFDQSVWVRGVKRAAATPCGTVGCIAGHIVMQGVPGLRTHTRGRLVAVDSEYSDLRVLPRRWHGSSIAEVAADLLGQPYADVSKKLFSISFGCGPWLGWCGEGENVPLGVRSMSMAYKAAQTAAARAYIAAARIEHYIETGE